MKIVIATDKFKGSLSSEEASYAIKSGLTRGYCSYLNKKESASLFVDIVYIADGGDGSAEVLQRYFKTREVKVSAVDPLGRKKECSYLVYDKTIRGNEVIKCAFIEMARVSGFSMLLPEERNPLYTTTFGLGELIADAVAKGAGEINVSIGGSATNDCGTAMLQALGLLFFNKEGKLLKENGYMSGADLSHISKIKGDLSHYSTPIFNVICDVTNPLLGDYGATMVYGPQKGAGPEDLEILESGMKNFASISQVGMENDISHLSGTGAAGGVGFALKRFLGAEIISGKNFFASVTGLEDKISKSDLVIGGEGKIDNQCFCGKVVDGILGLAKKYGKPVALFCGVEEIGEEEKRLIGTVPIFDLNSIEPDIDKCITEADALLHKMAESAVPMLMQISQKSSGSLRSL